MSVLGAHRPEAEVEFGFLLRGPLLDRVVCFRHVNVDRGQVQAIRKPATSTNPLWRYNLGGYGNVQFRLEMRSSEVLLQSLFQA